MIQKFLYLEWKAFFRSASFATNLALKILMGFVAAYFILVFLALGIGAFYILKKMNLDTYRNTDIGIVFQSYNLLPSLTAIENIILSMDISKVKVNNKKEKALSLMKSVGLSENQAKRKILKLSGGEQQRIAIARSLSYNPKIIIADEPTGNLINSTKFGF